MEVVQDHHLAPALDRRKRCVADDVGDLVRRDARARALDLAHVGVLSGQRQAGIAICRVVAPGHQQGGERTAGLRLRRARRADEQIGMHGVCRGERQLADGLRLPDDVSPHGFGHNCNRSATAAADAATDPFHAGPAIDDRPPLRVGGRHLTKAVSHSGVERFVLTLEAIELSSTHPSLEHIHRRVDQHDEIGPTRVQGPVVDLAQLVDRQASAVALVGEGRVDAAIADDMSAGGQRGCDDLIDVLGPVGGDQQCLRPIGEVRHRGVVEDGPDADADVGAAGLSGQQRLQMGGQAGRVRALASALRTLQSDVATPTHTRRTIPSRMARRCASL